MSTRLFLSILCGMAAIGLFLGFSIVGSPLHARHRMLDRQRVQQMGLLVSGINGFYKREGRLPPTIKPFINRLRQTDLPDANVRYRIVDKTTYELGATFLTDGQYAGEDYMGLHTTEIADHSKGEAWFRFDATVKDPYN